MVRTSGRHYELQTKDYVRGNILSQIEETMGWACKLRPFFDLWLRENYNLKGKAFAIHVRFGHHSFWNNPFQHSWREPIAKREYSKINQEEHVKNMKTESKEDDIGTAAAFSVRNNELTNKSNLFCNIL